MAFHYSAIGMTQGAVYLNWRFPSELEGGSTQIPITSEIAKRIILVRQAVNRSATY